MAEAKEPLLGSAQKDSYEAVDAAHKITIDNVETGSQKGRSISSASVGSIQSVMSTLEVQGKGPAGPPFDPQTIEEISLLEASDSEIERTFEALGTSQFGLTSVEANARLVYFGKNRVSSDQKLTWYRHLWNAFIHPFNLLLLTLAVVSGTTGDIPSAIVMSTLVFISVILRFWQEYKSAIAADSLRNQISQLVRVVRNGKARPVKFANIVPGDVIELSAGSLVPADMRLISMSHLLVNESALTGESMPAEKNAAPFDADAASAPADKQQQQPHANGDRKTAAPGASDNKDNHNHNHEREAGEDGGVSLHAEEIHRLNLCFMGTSVETGSALGVVIRTGDRTFMGQNAKTLVKRRPPTAFARGVKRVSFLLIGFMLAMVPIVVAVNGYVTKDWVQAALLGVAVAVGLTPEMLPMIVNTNLSRGAWMLSKQKVIVKRLEAIQNFGAMTVLCTDKTGTLTEDNVVLGDILDITGQKSTRTLQFAYYIAHYQTGFRNPLDQAIVKFVQEKRVLDPTLLKLVRKVAELPFDFKRRCMSVLVTRTQRTMSRSILNPEMMEHVQIEVPTLCTKGAVEEMLAKCTKYLSRTGESLPIDEATRTQIKKFVSTLNSQGLRLLAVGTREFDEPRTTLVVEDERNLCLTGFLGFHDPPKHDAPQGIKEVLEKGCSVKVLTGDNVLVARKVCSDLGLSAEHAITGEELAQVAESDTAKWTQIVKQSTIFAKLSPGQKAKIVKTLKDAGETVGFLGDGVNDALALREADVGISVDTATDLAKEAADIILTEKSLCVLSNGITEGRRTHGNTLKYIKMAASSNFGNVFSMLVASSWLPFLPMLPIHVLTQNLLYDISQISIPWDNMDPEYLAKPRGWSAKGIAFFMACLGPTSSIFDITTFCFMWFYYDIRDKDAEDDVARFQTAWFVLGLLTQTLIVHMIRTEKLPIIQSRPAPGVVILTLCVMATGLTLPNVKPLADLFGFVKLPLFYYAYLAVAIVCYMLITQVVKFAYIRVFKEWL